MQEFSGQRELRSGIHSIFKNKSMGTFPTGLRAGKGMSKNAREAR